MIRYRGIVVEVPIIFDVILLFQDVYEQEVILGEFLLQTKGLYE